MEELVGALGFEPRTSASRTQRANQTAPRPDNIAIIAGNAAERKVSISHEKIAVIRRL
jgi:hypothetical protein